ncbi:MAG: hypothetical protein V1857_04855 [archaeon]
MASNKATFRGNTKIHLYGGKSGNQLPFPARARWLGELSGTWRDIGAEYGRKSGDYVRLVFDASFKSSQEKMELAHILSDLSRYAKQVQLLTPQALEFLNGIAEGASSELDKSPDADACSHLEKVLFLSFRNEFFFRHPTWPHWPPQDRPSGCSALSVIGGTNGGTNTRTTIQGHNQDGRFGGLYPLAFVANPEDKEALRFWAMTSPGQIAGFLQVNEAGVAVSETVGGTSDPTEQDFGVPWQMLVFHAAAYSRTCRGASEVLTIGTEQYRKQTSRETVLRTGGCNFLISDPNETCAIEATAHRYALRRPTEFGETGKYLVVTNHNFCHNSFDEGNNRTDVPMTRFGGEEPPYSFLGTCERYWTSMWNLRRNYGDIDVPKMKELLSCHYLVTKDGTRVDHVWSDELRMWIPAHLSQEAGVTPCNHLGGFPEKYVGNTSASKVAELADHRIIVHWTQGRPCEWHGEWDSYEF